MNSTDNTVTETPLFNAEAARKAYVTRLECLKPTSINFSTDLSDHLTDNTF